MGVELLQQNGKLLSTEMGRRPGLGLIDFPKWKRQPTGLPLPNALIMSANPNGFVNSPCFLTDYLQKAETVEINS